MNALLIVIGVLGFFFLLVVAIWVGKNFQRITSPNPCYRCADVATTDFGGYHYCLMCRIVIIQALPAVRHDPPFGFPGAPGYLDWPKNLTEELLKKEQAEKQKKKEELHG
jgi:hypothetical protein